MTLDRILEPLWVEGTPVPQGSKKAWLNEKTGRVMMAEAAGKRHATWRAEVTAHARQHMADHGWLNPQRGPIALRLTFYRFRRGSDYGSGKNIQTLKPNYSPYPDMMPDIDKLTRSILDSLTGVVYVDDGQVVRLGVEKLWTDRYTGREGVNIVIKLLLAEGWPA